jgi:sulfur carrier protein ThiS
MASDIRIQLALRDSMLDLVNAAIGSGGFLRFYAGSKPPNADTGLTGQTLLAELGLSATPFAVAASGQIVANTITDDLSANADGTATWATFTKSDGTRIIDCTVGTSGSDINMNSVEFRTGARITVTSYNLNIL